MLSNIPLVYDVHLLTLHQVSITQIQLTIYYLLINISKKPINTI